jgi:hypothetical protein
MFKDDRKMAMIGVFRNNKCRPVCYACCCFVVEEMEADSLSWPLVIAVVKKMFGRSGGVTQAVKCLPSNHEALSSNPSTVEKQTKDDVWNNYILYI